MINKCHYPLLLNLARRLRRARRDLARAQRANCPVDVIASKEGARLEAHNSYQAAKQLVAELAD